jgi:hypothetical protein
MSALLLEHMRTVRLGLVELNVVVSGSWGPSWLFVFVCLRLCMSVSVLFLYVCRCTDGFLCGRWNTKAYRDEKMLYYRLLQLPQCCTKVRSSRSSPTCLFLWLCQCACLRMLILNIDPLLGVWNKMDKAIQSPDWKCLWRTWVFGVWVWVTGHLCRLGSPSCSP